MLANINLLEYIDLILDWGSSSCPSPAKKKACVEQEILLHSWKFLPNSVRSHWLLRGHIDTWHLTMKLFPAKISERATLQNLWRQRVTVHDHPRMLSWPTTAVTARFNEFSASKFRLRQHWDSRETKLTVSLGTNHYYYCGHEDCLVRENKKHH